MKFLRLGNCLIEQFKKIIRLFSDGHMTHTVLHKIFLRNSRKRSKKCDCYLSPKSVHSLLVEDK